MILGGGLLLAYILIFKKKLLNFRREDFYLFFQLTLFHIFFAFTLEFWGLQYVSGAKASLIYSLIPFITALYAYFLFNERMNTKKWLGLAIGFVGMMPVLFSCIPFETTEICSISGPELALLGSVSCAAYGWILLKECVNKGYSVIMANGIAMFFGGILSLVTSFIIEGSPHLKLPSHQNDIIADSVISFAHSFAPLILFGFYTIVFIIIANILAYNLYGYLLKRYSATFLAFAGFICPLFTAFFDWLLLGKIVSWSFIASFLVTSLGLYIFYKEELKDSSRAI